MVYAVLTLLADLLWEAEAVIVVETGEALPQRMLRYSSQVDRAPGAPTVA